ncbi:hypothetical protein [Sellimonas intestinalis]|uniref:hypothetical protein n=1 Tax=Sellimonas intestinalis TaxID=1653434 RepID=UPI00399F4218
MCQKEYTKDDIIQNKKEAIKSLNMMLEGFINDPAGNHLKKSQSIVVLDKRLCSAD